MAVSWSTNCPIRISSREKITEEVIYMTIFMIVQEIYVMVAIFA